MITRLSENRQSAWGLDSGVADLRESAKAGLALGGYETPISGYEISYRNPVLSVGFRYRNFLL